MRVLFLFIAFFHILTALSQDCLVENRKDRRVLTKLKNLIAKRAFYNALDVIESKKENAIFSALKSEIFWMQADLVNAELEAMKTISFCPENFPNLYYFLGEISFKRKDFVKAHLFLKKSIDLSIGDPYDKDAYKLFHKAKVLANIINNPVPFNPKIIDGISTQYDEYLPIISPDQNFAFFTRRSTVNNLHAITASTVEEFIVSKSFKGFFDEGNPLPYPFNQAKNEGGASITIDNKILYFTKCTRNKIGYNNCDIFYVFNNNGIWSEVQSFSSDISNENSWESQPTISSDGKTIIFASDRVGGYGGIDLYESIFVNGSWSFPRNLGDNINSSANEKSPYLHTDGKTLFFASDNFPSLGGFDIFSSRKDSFNIWKRPTNIGFPINSAFDEISFFVNTAGTMAYFASNQFSGVGGWDIYSFLLYEDARPNRVLFLNGILVDEYGNSLEDVELEIRSMTTNEVTVVSVIDGAYVSALTLQKEEDVLITIKKEGYAFNSTYISANNDRYYSPSTLNIELESLKEGSSFVIDDINFHPNRYNITSISNEVLKEFREYLKLNNSLEIEISGFTDNVGAEEDNLLLSEKRAKAVYDILVCDGGISQKRIKYRGYGEKSPVSNNSTIEGRASNRRTTFKIIKK